MYKLLNLRRGEQNICPFPHKQQDGTKKELEENASCGINEDGKFHCLTCKRGYTDENWFTAAYLNVSLNNAKKFNKMLEESRRFLPQRKKWKIHQERLEEELKNKDSKHFKYLDELGLIDLVKDARLGLYEDYLTLPTFFKGQIINLCQFRPGELPKYKNSFIAASGIITTTKRFKAREDYILLCAGEKDMLVATSKGYNAISILGGENAKPLFNKELFKGKKIYIAYDNDETGKSGGENLAEFLYNYTREIKVLNIGETYDNLDDLSTKLENNKDDITDFFVKYKYNDIDLNNIIDNCKWYQPPALENKSVIELIYETRKVLQELEKKAKEKNKKDE